MVALYCCYVFNLGKCGSIVHKKDYIIIAKAPTVRKNERQGQQSTGNRSVEDGGANRGKRYSLSIKNAIAANLSPAVAMAAPAKLSDDHIAEIVNTPAIQETASINPLFPHLDNQS